MPRTGMVPMGGGGTPAAANVSTPVANVSTPAPPVAAAPPQAGGDGTYDVRAAAAAGQLGPAWAAWATGTTNGKVIFLDVDGVLHPVFGKDFFIPRAMKCLRHIVEQTGATIVLSSMWQVQPQGRAEVDLMLRRWGMPPCLTRTCVNGPPGAGPERRAREIANWVKANPAACARGWVALDDLDLTIGGGPPAFLPYLTPGHFVRTKHMHGLDPNDAIRAIQILGQTPAPLPPPAPDCLAPVPRDLPPLARGVAPTPTGHSVWMTDARYGLQGLQPGGDGRPPPMARASPAMGRQTQGTPVRPVA